MKITLLLEINEKASFIIATPGIEAGYQGFYDFEHPVISRQ
jgi:hypothetical protein